MKDRRYDILRKQNGKSLIWLEDATDLQVAESRIKELSSFWPGEYQIFDLLTKQMVFNTADPVVATPSRE